MPDDVSVGEAAEKVKLSYGTQKRHNHFGPHHGPAIPLLNVDPTEMGGRGHRKAGTRMRLTASCVMNEL